jgi:acetyl esterase
MSCGEYVDPEIVEFLRGINASPETDLQAMPLPAALQLMRGSSLTTVPAVEADLEIRSLSIPGAGGAVPLRLYLPDRPQPYPVIINIHGGGFVSGSLNMDNHRCTTLARRLGAALVSVDYRLAPEHPYPAALDDCYATLEWAASGRGGPMLDVSRIALLGSSSGGNLAACTALLSRDRSGPRIAAQVLIYPVCDDDLNRDSYYRYRSGYFLTRRHMQWYLAQYQSPATRLSPGYYMPLKAGDLRGLPAALVITAGPDPLRDEAELFAQHLERAGVPVIHRNYEGTIHGFLSAAPSSHSSTLALGECAKFLKQAFRIVDD